MKNKKKMVVILLFLCIIVVAVVFGSKLFSKKDAENNPTNPSEQVGSADGTTPEGENGESTNPLQPGQPAGAYATRGESGNKINTSGKMQDTKNLKGLELNNVNLETLGSKTVMLADVKNTTKSTIEAKKIKIDLLSEDNKVIKTLEGTIDTVEADQMTQLNIEAEGDFVDVYDYRIYE